MIKMKKVRKIRNFGGSKREKNRKEVSAVDERGICLGQKRADYVLVLKGNQGSLMEDVRLYFSDKEFPGKCAYKKTVEKARGKTEKREYWQTDDISWLSQKKDWEGLKASF